MFCKKTQCNNCMCKYYLFTYLGLLYFLDNCTKKVGIHGQSYIIVIICFESFHGGNVLFCDVSLYFYCVYCL